MPRTTHFHRVGLGFKFAVFATVFSIFRWFEGNWLSSWSDVLLSSNSNNDASLQKPFGYPRSGIHGEQTLELPELAGSYEDLSSTTSSSSSSLLCPSPLLRFNDTIVESSAVWDNRKIPRIVHFTSKSRCMTQNFVENLQKWNFPNHSVFLHDDAAVDRLLQRHWPQFPHLQMGMSCLLSGAGKADLWRAIILYEYGGIYSDIDNSPNQFHGDTIEPDDEAFFVVEQIGIMSQWFMAARPKHPYMYLLVQETLNRLMQVVEVDKQYVPFVTGPGGVKNAMIHFMNAARPPPGADVFQQFQKVRQGTYVGMDNATVRVVGMRGNQNQYVCRSCVRTKGGDYIAMDMQHFSKVKPRSNSESCLYRIYRTHEQHRQQQGGGVGDDEKFDFDQG